MKQFVLFVSLFLLLSSCSARWEDCGIPLTREIYYQSVTVSPSPIDISSKSANRIISININANLQTQITSGIQVYVKVQKDGVIYFDAPVGDLCSILLEANQFKCPLTVGTHSFSYIYEIPPLPTGTYTISITTINTKTGDEIGCLAVHQNVTGLSTDSCNYLSTFTADLIGTAVYGRDANDVETIQIGTFGPNGTDLGFEWGTFKTVSASPDVIGYGSGFKNYVWGISGTIQQGTTGTTFQGKVVIGYLPDTSTKYNAILVHQGTFNWQMTKNADAINPPYVFQSGTFNLAPLYEYNDAFGVPVNLGNLNPFQATVSTDGSSFTVTAARKWCRCNCGLGATPGGGSGNSDTHQNRFIAGTIATVVIGGFIIIVAIIVLVVMLRSSREPLLYDDNDVMDPQKPDYGTIAINEAFENDEKDYL